MKNNNSQKLNLFGLTPSRKDSRILITPVPWEVTTSYGSGTSLGPESILKASPQIDLFDIEYGNAYEVGYFLDSVDKKIKALNTRLKRLAQKVIKKHDAGSKMGPQEKAYIETVNKGTNTMVDFVYSTSLSTLKEKKIPAVLGGDHSTPLGLIKALGEFYKSDFGILHIDAHADLRLAYQGFTHSHASIMRNAMLLDAAPKKLVQVAIRDFCQEEYDYIESEGGRIKTYFDRDLKQKLFSGASWDNLCQEIAGNLPKNVYVSFDIDGLSPEFCPHTGTPVPGGLSFDQATHLLSSLGRAGKKIIGFDLNEVAPGKDTEWDANVGSRILFKLCGLAAKTNF